MITEDCVSFETAKLLKEKGFEGATLYYYDEDGDLLFPIWRADASKNEFVAPTLQMVMKWLREKHNIHIELGVLKPYGTDEHRHATPKEGVIYHAEIFHIDEWNKYLEEFKHVGILPKGTYEEACEAAIKYCLENLI